MEWLELIKLMGDADTKANLTAQVQAQGKALTALAEHVAKLDGNLVTMSNNHADMIVQAHMMAFAGLLGLALLAIYAIWSLILLERRLKRMEAQLKVLNLEYDSEKDVLDVEVDDRTIMRLTLQQLKDLAAHSGRPVPANFVPAPKSTP